MPMTFQLNINGLSEVSQKYKITALEERIHSNENYIPYFFIMESHLKSRHFDNEIAIRDYSLIRADRLTILKGGVILYSHKDFVIDDQDIYADTICQAVMAYNSNINLVIAAIYRPPRADNKSFTTCLQQINLFISKHSDADLHISGDLNHHLKIGIQEK